MIYHKKRRMMAPSSTNRCAKALYERVQTDTQRQVEQPRAEHQAALDALPEQLRQCQAHDGLLSPLAELAHKTGNGASCARRSCWKSVSPAVKVAPEPSPTFANIQD